MKRTLEGKEILEVVFDLVRAFSKLMPFVPEAEKMNTLEFYLFMFVALKGPTSMSKLAEELSVSKSNITVTVDKLEKKGFLKRKRSDLDRRVVMIELTKKGEKLFNAILRNFENMLKNVVSKIPEDDLKVISEGFERITRVFLKGGEGE
ncbi:MarR family transcriptional regulator [Thermotoga sp.]|uniref:MarR family winged helix-turn-helix transcriptional regulator n=1 Tax=Thermotoga sp. TaxID=28240 RepID=UPI0025E94966|nr:MarR family transcriptional regulator [Thermotoga sp.]MCD6551197.1 MarR family transcriptional regulator [Thermotoga sp.]